jgi:serine protease Do
MKKLSPSVLGVCTVAIGAALVLGVSHLTSRARENAANISVSATPVNRDARQGTSFSPVVKKAAPSVVNIFTTRFVKERPRRNPFMNDPLFRQFFGQQPGGDDRERIRPEQSLGSGVVVSADGYILTANHVVADADEIKVAVSGNKTKFNAKVIGKDPATDIAVLKISTNNLTAITLADSDQLEVGDIVLALGNPFGIGQTVTKGIVSALGRSGLGFNGYENFIQTDAAINPGNSGGALVDIEGRLVGINTAIISGSGGNQGIGFAVPINMAKNVLDRLIAGGKLTRGYLGIAPQDVDANFARQFNLPGQSGALVSDVLPNSPAQKAGLKSGDVIIAINDKGISDANNLKLTVSQILPDTRVSVKYVRDGATKTVSAMLAELPGGANGADDSPDSSTDTGKADMLDGVSVADLDDQARQQLRIPSGISGAVVTDLTPASNAAEAGLRPNDVIEEVNRQPVNDAGDAVKFCKASREEQILVKIWRRGSGAHYLSVDNLKHAK